MTNLQLVNILWVMIFPDPRAPTEDGLIAIGGELTVENLCEAYRKGIFPWPQEGLPMLWFSPEKRGILDFADFHISSSLQKFKRKNPQISFTINEAFDQVIRGCREQKRKDQNGTWILEEMEEAYKALFSRGLAISIECWERPAETSRLALVGGIYGVLIDGLFSGESMFHRRTNASKLALCHLVEYLRSQGYRWMDIQMVTPLLEAFGGKYISREEFLRRKGL